MFMLLASFFLALRATQSIDGRARRITGAVLATFSPLLLLALIWSEQRPHRTPHLAPLLVGAALATDAYLMRWGFKSDDPQGVRNVSAIAGLVLFPLILFDALGLAIIYH